MESSGNELSYFMPVYQHFTPCPGLVAATWKITEPEQEMIRLYRPRAEEYSLFATLTHPRRRLQWLACRALLQSMTGTGAVIGYDPNGKPCLAGDERQVSLSHSGEMAAVLLSDDRPAGIDIERITPRLERVADRFLSDREMAGIPGDNRTESLCALWTAKEALYKVSGDPATDLRHDIHVPSIDYLCSPMHPAGALITAGGIIRRHAVWHLRTGDFMLAVAW